MGTEYSKEEVIIAQAGNSGGLTNNPSIAKAAAWSLKDILGLGVLILAIFVIIYFCWNRYNKFLKQKIRREIALSQERV